LKTWHVVLLVSAVALVGVVILMKSAQAKATPVNTSFNNPLASGIGLAVTALPSIMNLFKDSGNPYKNEGTYQTGIVPIQSGNTLTDPNTGSVLVYGTD
jgi:hypothetical protein